MCDLLGEKFNSPGTLTEYDCLINLQLGEEGIETVQFLSFLEVCVVLGYTLKGELVHQVYELGVWDVFLLETSDSNWVSG